MMLCWRGEGERKAGAELEEFLFWLVRYRDAMQRRELDTKHSAWRFLFFFGRGNQSPCKLLVRTQIDKVRCP